MNQIGQIKMKFGDNMKRKVIINPLIKSKMILEISVILMKQSRQVTQLKILQVKSRNHKKTTSARSKTIKYKNKAHNKITCMSQ